MEMPDNPLTATIAALQSDTAPDVFAFCIRFPKEKRDDKAVTLSVVSVHGPNDVLSLSTAPQFTAGIVDELHRRSRIDLRDNTNWVSVTAAVQKVIEDWNKRHHH